MVMQRSYWGNIKQAIASLSLGMRLTLKHLVNIRKRGNPQAKHNIQHPDYFTQQKGVATVQYPHEQLLIPDTGRYQLHNEIDDCIVCDKCVKVCPVNCITIEPIRAPEEFGKTSDGTSKRIYAATFDIDMGQCCFCGLCTTVCPTECLTMTPTFDFSTYNMAEHNFQFGNMTDAEIELRKKEWVDYQAKKQTTTAVTPSTTASPAAAPKVVIKPKVIIPKPPSQA